MPTLRNKMVYQDFSKEESEYDVFGAGHSSTSINVAGIDAANRLIKIPLIQ